jgi:hypothetical protein
MCVGVGLKKVRVEDEELKTSSGGPDCSERQVR